MMPGFGSVSIDLVPVLYRRYYSEYIASIGSNATQQDHGAVLSVGFGGRWCSCFSFIVMKVVLVERLTCTFRVE
jgi:hypothetical protein